VTDVCQLCTQLRLVHLGAHSQMPNGTPTCCAGGSGEHGLLTKEQAREMKCYQTKQQVLCDPHVVQELCAETRMLLQQVV
jgi:hypothetical protein